MQRYDESAAGRRWQQRLYVIIFEHDTPAGKAFDVVLLAVIALSVLVVLLDSVPSIHERHGAGLLAAEWVFTVLFTVEYAMRLAVVRSPLRYARSFYGLVDLLAILPTYVSVFLTGAQELIVIRSLRILRVFRVLKLPEYLAEAGYLSRAMRASRRKITVFVTTVLMLVLIIGSLMHLIEGPKSGFTSIPISIYWAIVTLTTVGYGDIAPQTPLGRMLASGVMIIGYAIIAVPTGIVTAELVNLRREYIRTVHCPVCGTEGHDDDARFCRVCGTELPAATATDIAG
ncbi:MAG TPA: ion transporter [Tepidisphaeraceae bacterium]|nr:ion transporter [Tepidisphaeraceae bacterium]